MKNLRDTLAEIGKQCSENRKTHNISLEQLSYELGYTKENLYSFERGKNNNLYIYLFYKEKGLI